MPILSRPIPGLFGGVSQQVPAMRHATQCEIQENALATIVDGLTKREGIQHIKSLAQTGANGASIASSAGAVFTHFIDRGSLPGDVLVMKNGSLMVYGLSDGVARTITFPNGLTYLNAADPAKDFRAVTVADYTFILNRTVTSALTAEVAESRPIDRALVYVKQTVASITYRIHVGGTTATFTSDSDPTTKEIVDGLVTSLNANLPAGYTVTVVVPPNGTTGPVISIERDSGAAIPQTTCTDDYGNLAILAIHESVSVYTDLPASLGSTTGAVIKISANPSNTKGAYWVRWDVTGQQYEEVASPGVQVALDPATMPHKLVRNGDGTYTFSRITNWSKRDAGDDDSNPIPSFVGATLNDVFFARNRLGFLSLDSVIMSKSGRYFGFWADTAQQVLDTDPIDLSSPISDVVSLDWAVPFNEDVFIWSGKQQLRLEGGDVLTPKSARLEPVSSFEADMRCRPAPLGNKCAFATTAGDWASVRLLKIAADTLTQADEDISDHIPRYVPAGPRKIVASTTAKMLAVLPSGSVSELYVFKYEQDQKEALVQRAWCRFSVEDTAPQTSKIVGSFWVDRRLYLLRYTVSPTYTGGQYVLELLDFQGVRADTDIPFSLRLDRKLVATSKVFASGSTTITVPYAEHAPLVALRAINGYTPASLSVTSQVVNADGTTTLVVPGDVTSATVWVGRRFTMRYRFSEFFLRDSEGNPIQAISLSVKHVICQYKDTGFFQAEVTPFLRQTYTYPFSGNLLGQIPLGTPQLSTGEFKIPVAAKPHGTSVDLVSDSFFPATFPYAVWVGSANLRAQP